VEDDRRVESIVYKYGLIEMKLWREREREVYLKIIVSDVNKQRERKREI
jgi:hypothetical protein